MRPASQSRRSMLAALAATVALGLVLTLATSRLEDRAGAARFDRLADLVAGTLQQRMTQHIALLRATRSYLEAEHGHVDASEFAEYVADLQLGTNSPGIQGIGFAPLVDSAASAVVADRLSAMHGRPLQIRPPTDQPSRAPIALLEPRDDRNNAALGYDMFSDPVRRAALLAAQTSLDPRATGPVQLVQEITADKQTGFLIYLRTRTGLAATGDTSNEGVVYAPFRAGDLHRAVLNSVPDLALTLRSVDLGDPDRVLFDNTAKDTPAWLRDRAVTRDIDIAGRHWQITVTPTQGLTGIGDRSATLTVGALSLMLLGAVWVAMASLGRSLEAARRTAELAGRQAEERALLLREMQHRIKNHIARIQAIARQSVRGAADMAEFERIFGGRLNAMAKAQDTLGRDGSQEADLRSLLQAELVQVLDAATVGAALSGPQVNLGGRETQAVGLVAHELVTNAMKYGSSAAADTPDRRLRVSWQIAQRAEASWLVLDWFEPNARPGTRDDTMPGGFGTQLIEALVEGDLGGSFARQFDSHGMHVTIAFPLTGT